MVDRLHILRFFDAKRAIALLSALVVLAGAIGVPLPRFKAKDTSRPFPCMHHACGCHSAEACWQGCCCMTHEQKLAWAKEYHVRPPENIIAATRPSAHGPSPARQKACCRGNDCDQDADAESAEGVAIHLVQFEDARKCQGLGSLWLMLSQALPPAAKETVEADLTLVSSLAAANQPQLVSPAFDPVTPPPRAAL